MSNTGHVYIAPRTPIEEALAKIWGQVLGCECVGVEDHFQDMGGTSLHATRIFAHLRDDLGVNLSRSLILQFPTVAQMAAYIETYQKEPRLDVVATATKGTQGRQEDRGSSFSE